MAKGRMALITVLLCLFVFMTRCYVMAASTTDATKPINIEQDCSINLSYTYDQIVFSNLPVRLYKIASVSPDFQYTLTDKFSPSGLVLNGIQTNSEWNAIRSTLEAHAVADNLETDGVSKTDSNGKVSFESLKPGLYLVLVDAITQNDTSYLFDSVLVALPGLSADNDWQFQVFVTSKAQIIPPHVEDIELNVIKLWKDDNKKSNRPSTVEVEIFQNGTSYKNIVLSENNNWSYNWTAKDDGSKWTVIERNTPLGYVMTVEERDTSFILTNTYTPTNPNESTENPETGDTRNIMLYVLLTFFSGSMLIFLGIIGKRYTYDDYI